MSEPERPIALDLGIEDVHQPAAVGIAPTKRSKKVPMATLPTKKRNALPRTAFALPSQRKYPLPDADHVRSAESYLEKEHNDGKVSDAEYRTAKRNIARAARRFGVSSKYNKGKTAGRKLHIRAELGEGGSLHVRHLSDDDRVIQLDGVLVALADDAAKPVWIQLAKPGAFRGHPAGPFELSERIFQEIVRNFNQSQNHEIPIDFEHASEADPTDGSIPVSGAPAQGWIREMKIDSGNLWGLVHWGDLARQYIKSGQYKYFSPAIRFGAKDRVTGQPIGARMSSGALTNEPFLDGLRPLAAKDQTMTTPDAQTVLPLKLDGLAHSPSEYMPQIKRILNLHPLATAAECSDHLDRLYDHLDAVGGDHTASHEGVNLSSYCMGLRDLTGAAPGDTWQQVFDAVKDMIDAAMDQHVIEDHGGDAGGGGGEEQQLDDGMDMSAKAALATLKNTIAALAI